MGPAFQSGLRICARSFQPEVDMDNLPCSARLANIQKKLLHLKRDGGVAMMFWLDRPLLRIFIHYTGQHP